MNLVEFMNEVRVCKDEKDMCIGGEYSKNHGELIILPLFLEVIFPISFESLLPAFLTVGAVS